MAVITISRLVGSGGDEVARRVCELLDYRYFDKVLLAQVAQELGVAEAEAVDFSDDTYRMRSFVDALLRRSAPVSTASVWTSTAQGVATKTTTALDEDTASRFEASAIRSLRERGRVVVCGRGGQAILRGEPDVLHVRIVAGREDRIPRLMQDAHMTRGAANAYMDERDHAVADYLKRFHNIDWTDPLLYHLIINTSLFSLEKAAQMIVAALRQMEAQ
jgi:cytidylate kinase